MSDVQNLKCTAFISYARDDKSWVDTFAKDLDKVTSSVWYDENLQAGTKWWSEICKQIRENSVFVCLLSSRSVKSVNCRAEILYAIGLNKPILPIWVHQDEEEQKKPNEKIYYLGDEIWQKINDTQVKNIVIEQYLENDREGLHIAMEVGHDICQLAINLSLGAYPTNLDIDEPELPKYKTDDDFHNALDRCGRLFMKNDFYTAREICIKIENDSNGQYKNDTDFFIEKINERINYEEIKNKISDGEIISAERRLKRYKEKYGKTTQHAKELERELDVKSKMLLAEKFAQSASESDGLDLDDDD